MIFRNSHGIGRLSQLTFNSLGRHRHELLPYQQERVAESIGIALARLRGGNGCIQVCVTPLCRRTYATRPVSRPKAHTGRTTSAPRQKAASGTQARAKAPSTGAKAPSAGKAKGRTRAKAKTRAKALPKKRKSRAKARAKSTPRPRKRLSETQKLRKAKQKKSADIIELKKRALSPPAELPQHAWTNFLGDQFRTRQSDNEYVGGQSGLGGFSKVVGMRWRALSPAQREVCIA